MGGQLELCLRSYSRFTQWRFNSGSGSDVPGNMTGKAGLVRPSLWAMAVMALGAPSLLRILPICESRLPICVVEIGVRATSRSILLISPSIASSLPRWASTLRLRFWRNCASWSACLSADDAEACSLTDARSDVSLSKSGADVLAPGSNENKAVASNAAGISKVFVVHLRICKRIVRFMGSRGFWNCTCLVKATDSTRIFERPAPLMIRGTRFSRVSRVGP